MSAAGTHTKEEEEEEGGKRERNGVSTEEKDGWHEKGRERRENKEGKQEGGGSLPSEIRRHTTQASCAGRDLLCHVSVRQLVRK